MNVWHDAYAQKGPCGEMNFDPEFKETAMMEQLAKIIDSESVRDAVDPDKFKPVDTVITDDGDTFKVSAKQAHVIRETIFSIPTTHRLDALKDMQTTEGLKYMLEHIGK